ncbi:hypothetical protein HGP28_16005 [Vibrio sp. SM6]|uniref:protein-tyrosine-phosphatase n=1 Tax=Vibrio agarilyticus TaxID=2726741 RepID=A0A7X8TT74_9VIBR|nr:hypothetical protein [Vibrio agarilyticus]
MYDIHAHVIPNIDDGPKDFNTSLDILKEMYQQGIEGVIATPHIRLGKFNNTISTLSSAYHQFCSDLGERHDIPKLKYAAEVHLTPDLVPWVKNNKVPYLAKKDQTQYVLLELPENHYPSGTNQLCKWLLNNGVIPVIAHPERCRYWYNSSAGISALVEIGCLMQITASSIIGRFRQESMALAMGLIESNKVFCIASDTHNLTHRSCQMLSARDKINNYFDKEIVDDLFVNNPKMLFVNCINDCA